MLPDDEYTLDYGYASRVTTEFMKLGARGVSVLFSSGDSGSGCRSGNTFVPTFPAASVRVHAGCSCWKASSSRTQHPHTDDHPSQAYVTAVGATSGATPTEGAASFSSGGFSNYWQRTDAPYQADAVSAYLAAGNLPTQSYWNATGRAFPDVSAAGEAYNIVVSGRTMRVSGTSCSCPAFAGIVALLNDARFAAGKTPLGFLNPLFYKNAAAFNDITTGTQGGCGSAGGFPVRAGWDPVTGLGTPNFPKLLAVVMALP